MCGRFTLASSADKISEYFGIECNYELKPRYNIAPSQDILVIRESSTKKLEFVFMRWGLIPSWQKEADIGTQWVNARSESVAVKPLFKNIFKKKRCLIVADGFFEWQIINKKTKQPYYIYKSERKPFGIASIWESWKNNEGAIIESCLLLTSEACPTLHSIHDRMPVILQRPQFAQWLDRENEQVDKLNSLLIPYLPNDLAFHAVSTTVNNPRNDTRECIQEDNKT